MTREERVQVVVETMRFLSAGWLDNTEDQEWAAGEAEIIAGTDFSDSVCCPLCQEITCDNNCPLAPVRGEKVTDE